MSLAIYQPYFLSLSVLIHRGREKQPIFCKDISFKHIVLNKNISVFIEIF